MSRKRRAGVLRLHPLKGRNGRLYTGITDNIVRRMWEHEEGLRPGFTSRYGVKTLVRFKAHETRESAFVRELRIKTRNWLWKLELIEKANPGWRDLKSDFV